MEGGYYEHPHSCTPLGAGDIAELLSVQHQTVWSWHSRGVLPDPDWLVSSRPAWCLVTIHRWATDTGRWHPPS